MKRKLNRFWRQLTADKKKFGMFVAVLAVGLLLWGRLMFLEKVPKVATADPKAKADQKQNTEQKKDETEKPSEIVLPSLGEVRVDLSHDLALDLFTFRHNRYKPLPEGETGPDGVQPVNPGDDEALRRRMLEELRNSLSLQSVIQGPRPAIVVNGRIVRVGGSIEGFKVVAVFDRSATMSREGLEFTLTMTSE